MFSFSLGSVSIRYLGEVDIFAMSVLYKTFLPGYNSAKIITMRMAIANGTCVSFCNHYLATSITRVTPVCRCGCKHLATSRESKARFGFLWVRPWDNRYKFYMDGKRIQCLSNESQHVPIYHQPYWSKIATFSYPTSV